MKKQIKYQVQNKNKYRSHSQKRNGSAWRASSVYLFINSVRKLNMYQTMSERIAATLNRPIACALVEYSTDCNGSVLV